MIYNVSLEVISFKKNGRMEKNQEIIVGVFVWTINVQFFWEDMLSFRRQNVYYTKWTIKFYLGKPKTGVPTTKTPSGLVVTFFSDYFFSSFKLLFS